MEDAMHVKNGVLAVLAAAGSAAANALGGWDGAIKLLLIVMAVDYVTGILLAAVWHKSTKTETGGLSSVAGFKGLVKKVAILALVVIGVMADRAMDTDYIRLAVILFFIGNEGISLLENFGMMGVPFPDFLKKMLEALRDKGDNGRGGDAGKE